MTDDLFITSVEVIELRSTVGRLAGVISILERDLRESERKRRKLYDMLETICKQTDHDRCWLPGSCRDCPVKQTLEDCK